MSRLIDADELRNGLFHGYVEGKTDLTEREMGYQAGWNDALMYGVADAPTVDAVEVVRCKDCKWVRVITHPNAIKDAPTEYPNEYPNDWMECAKDEKRIVEEDDFCSWGERR